MFKTELYKQPRIVKYKKKQRGSFKVMRFFYNRSFVLYKKNVVGLVAYGSGFYFWKPVVDFQKRIGYLFKKRKAFKLRFNFSLNWNFSQKTHKSRMGKGKGLVGIDGWCARIQCGKPILFLGRTNNSPMYKNLQSICLRLWRSSLILPVSVLPMLL